MSKIKLNFLETLHEENPDIVTILSNYGAEICEYGKDYFNYVVTSSHSEGVLINFSLYLIAPEIGYDYRVINVEIDSVSEVTIKFFTLVTKQTEHFKIDISKGVVEYDAKLGEIFSSSLFNASLRFLVDQILMKRESLDS